MKLSAEGKPVFSPRDLVIFSMSPFASWMDRAYGEGYIRVTPGEDEPSMELLGRMGEEHEKKVLEGFRAVGDVCDLTSGQDFETRCERTRKAVERRENVIYQAALRGSGFEGYSDFICLNDDNTYQIWDTKLALSPKPHFVIQLCAYAEMFAETCGEKPAPKFGIILGPPRKEGEKPEQMEFPLVDFRDYFSRLKERFFAFHENFRGDIWTRPEPDPSADHGCWNAYVEEMFLECDHLCRVAGITRGQIEKLTLNGIDTLSALADNAAPIPKFPSATLNKLTIQARLQRETAKLRENDPNCRPLFELIPRSDDELPQGLYTLPPPSPNDIFFDMEGYPFNGGLEYLFGAVTKKRDGGYDFHEFWAHDRAQEKKAFEDFIDWAFERWQNDTKLHIYHYANYEKNAVSNLMNRHDTRSHEVDELLRNDVFVDLFRVVKNGVYIGEESYSLKKVEHLYGVVRGENVASAVDSVIQYAKWKESGESGDWRKSKTLSEIRDYNIVDCESTGELYEWLRKTADENGIAFVAPQKLSDEQKEKPETPEIVQRRAAAVSRLRQMKDRDAYAEAISNLVNFHSREEKPGWWRFYQLSTKRAEELREEPDCIAEIERIGEPEQEKRSLKQLYSYDRGQECKLSARKEPDVYFLGDIRTSVKLILLDHSKGELSLKASQDKLNKLPFNGGFPAAGTLISHAGANSGTLRNALLDIAEKYLEGNVPASLASFLERRPPHDAVLRSGETAVDAAKRIAETMDGDCLVIQGPPGTGKTYTAARLILSLLKKGKRVGITSNSHKAILNLVRECCETAEKENIDLDVIKGAGGKEDQLFEKFACIKYADTGPKAFDAWFEGGKTALICGTAWLFASDNWVKGDDTQLDFLFVDEAGQVAIANLASMSRSTKNFVLLGDQMQLEQPVQGSHPGDSGLSALQYALKDDETSTEGRLVIHAVVPDGSGIFLSESRRMHPDVCGFISESIYEERLTAFADCKNQRIDIAKNPNAFIQKECGIVFSPVEHSDNVQSSSQEVDRVEAIYNELLGREYTRKDGTKKPLDIDDFLFISPYNAQVVLLTGRLGENARVGSVDRLQGQQAAVCILSLCSSFGEYGSRGLSFILDLNRINVAVSRAECLAVIVADPRIASESAGSIREMKLLNLFCKLASYCGDGEK